MGGGQNRKCGGGDHGKKYQASDPNDERQQHEEAKERHGRTLCRAAGTKASCAGQGWGLSLKFRRTLFGKNRASQPARRRRALRLPNRGMSDYTFGDTDMGIGDVKPVLLDVV